MKLGFIGCGNMAKAMIKGIIDSKTLLSNDIIASDILIDGLNKTSQELSINIAYDNKEVMKKSEMVILAIKPQYYNEVIDEIKTLIDEQIIITIAPGHTLYSLQKSLGDNVKIVRCMPNTPAMVSEGMTAVCPNNFVKTEELKEVCRILNGFGKCEVVNENMMDAVVSVSGSSPAYVYMFIEALADGAVLEGMPRDMAYKFAAQAVYGSAKMVLETKMHPGELKDMVCSPGGTTIEAVSSLESTGFRNSVMKAMKAAAEKCKKL